MADDEIDVPTAIIDAAASLRFPASCDRRLQQLMDGNNEGTLTAAERHELESLVDFTEAFSIVRAGARRLLGRTEP